MNLLMLATKVYNKLPGGKFKNHLFTMWRGYFHAVFDQIIGDKQYTIF